MAEEQTPVPPAPPTQSTSGLDPKIAGLLAYLFGWLGGLIIFLIEKDNKEVRFHALQSIAFSVVLGLAYFIISIFISILMGILTAIGSIFALLGVLLGLVEFVIFIGALVIWIVLMIKAYNEEHYKLPIIGDFVEQYV